MKLEIKACESLCRLEVFKINDVCAYSWDFGTQEDMDTASAEPYACGDMHFKPKLPTQEILDKYKISVDEYKIICDELEEKLSFGCCGWCV